MKKKKSKSSKKRQSNNRKQIHEQHIKSNITKMIGSFLTGAATVLGVFWGIHSFYPNVSIYPGKNLSPQQPFTTPFIVENIGNVYEYAHNTSLFVSLTSHLSKQNIEIQQSFANVIKRLKICEYYRNVYNKVLSEPNSYQFELIKPLVNHYKEHVDKLILDLKNLNQFLDH